MSSARTRKERDAFSVKLCAPQKSIDCRSGTACPNGSADDDVAERRKIGELRFQFGLCAEESVASSDKKFFEPFTRVRPFRFKPYELCARFFRNAPGDMVGISVERIIYDCCIFHTYNNTANSFAGQMPRRMCVRQNTNRHMRKSVNVRKNAAHDKYANWLFSPFRI